MPVMIDSLQINTALVGSKTRNQRGHQIVDRRRAKLELEFALAPKTLDEAMMYRSLILGDGEFWSMNSSIYGSKGYPITGTGAFAGASGGNPHNVNGVWRCASGQTMRIRGWFYDQSALGVASSALFGATVIGWRYESTANLFRVFGWSWRTYDTTATVKREALGTSAGLGTLGTPQAYTGAETFAVTSRDLVVTASGAGNYNYSQMMVIPWYLKAAQIDALIAGRNLVQYQLPRLPMVYVQSDFFPTDNQKGSPVGLYDSSLICHGEVDRMTAQPVMQAGVFDKTTLSLTGRLTEV